MIYSTSSRATDGRPKGKLITAALTTVLTTAISTTLKTARTTTLTTAITSIVVLSACSSDFQTGNSSARLGENSPNSSVDYPTQRIEAELSQDTSAASAPDSIQSNTQALIKQHQSIQAIKGTAVIQESIARSSVVDAYHAPQRPPPYIKPSPDFYSHNTQPNTENYHQTERNSIHQTTLQPVSTFSVDVDTGSYTNVRRLINSGYLPPLDAVRAEEFINYFNYDYPQSDDTSRPFTLTTEVAPSPWNNNRHLLHVGIQGLTPESLGLERPNANLVFLLDVSGSMHSNDKLPLLKSSIRLLSKQLTEHDRVSIVVYAGASGAVLESVAGNQHHQITSALDKLQAGGSTNGAAGLSLAYQLAKKGFIPDGINRVILATDGDFNVGVADVDNLKEIIAKQRKARISLTTLGFGTGNYNDHLMEQLANIGDGNHAYIDSLSEARKVLVEELDATLLTIARDVKIQIEFNPAQISEYRLIGYENRVLANEDFSNDQVDAGEIGAGHSVTALYEIALQGQGGEAHTPLRYGQDSDIDEAIQTTDELLELRLRYKPVIASTDAQSDSSLLISRVIEHNAVLDDLHKASTNMRFSAAVAGFAELLRGSKYVGEVSFSDIVSLASDARGEDALGYRSEFLQLVRLADELTQTTEDLITE